jgi:hypothetical protein
LENAEFIRFDASGRAVMITRWFKFNPPMKASHLKGIRHTLERLPSQHIWQEATAELEEAAAKATEEAWHSDSIMNPSVGLEDTEDLLDDRWRLFAV